MGLTAKLRCGNCGSRCRLVAALVVLYAWAVVGAAPAPPLTTEQPPVFDTEDALVFLHRYGYLNDSNFNVNSPLEDRYKDALIAYQQFSSLPTTGILDAATKQMMQVPRCGVKDINSQGHERRRRKRYALMGPKFLTNHVTYRLLNAPANGSQLTEQDVLDTLEQATAAWSSHTPLNFSRAQNGSYADIIISFQRGDHGVFCDSFEGPGGDLAHTYLTLLGSVQLHFDADENWTLDGSGINFFQVAVHELGHTLGLVHSDEPDAVMAPSYHYKPNFTLHSDDINGIQALYGSRDEPQSVLSWLTNLVTHFKIN